MQTAELFDDQGLHLRLLNFWNMCSHGVLNADQWIKLWVCDDLANGRFDEVSPSQTKWVRLSKVLLSWRRKCCWRNIGAVFRTAPFLIESVAQFLVACSATRGLNANELSKAGCA